MEELPKVDDMHFNLYLLFLPINVRAYEQEYQLRVYKHHCIKVTMDSPIFNRSPQGVINQPSTFHIPLSLVCPNGHIIYKQHEYCGVTMKIANSQLIISSLVNYARPSIK